MRYWSFLSDDTKVGRVAPCQSVQLGRVDSIKANHQQITGWELKELVMNACYWSRQSQEVSRGMQLTPTWPRQTDSPFWAPKN